MRVFLRLTSSLGLGLTVFPAFLVALGMISWQTHASLMIAGTLIWFGSAPLWMKPGN